MYLLNEQKSEPGFGWMNGLGGKENKRGFSSAEKQSW